MVYLLYFGERIQPASRWLFWRSNHAYVSAWIDVADVASAEAKAADKVSRKAWRILRYDRAISVEERKLPLGWWAYRSRINHARRDGAHYEFCRASPSGNRMMWCGSPILTAMNFGGQAENWDIRPENVPASLRSTFELGAKWAIGDDVMRSRTLRRASTEKLRHVVEAVMPLRTAIEKWCDARRDTEPVPDEVTMFDRLLEAVTQMEAEIANRTAGRRQRPALSGRSGAWHYGGTPPNRAFRLTTARMARPSR
jgi:hypothetical protein